MKITRAYYPGLFALYLFILFQTINQFSHEVATQLIPLFAIIIVILIIVMFILGRKDKDFIDPVSDERSKKIDRTAGYYSWWFTIVFISIFGIIADIQKFTPFQVLSSLVTEMAFTMVIFHMYFNFKRNS